MNTIENEVLSEMLELDEPRGSVLLEEEPRKYGKGFGRRPAANIVYETKQDIDVASSPRFNESDLSKGFREMKSEKFEHRIIGFLKSQGYSNIEIAKRTGYHASYISQVIRFPWVRDLIMQEIRSAGRDAVRETLEASALDSVEYLISTRDSEKASHRDRISCAKELLNRVYGMPNQPITYQEKVDLDALSDDALAKIAFQGGGGAN